MYIVLATGNWISWILSNPMCFLFEVNVLDFMVGQL